MRPVVFANHAIPVVAIDLVTHPTPADNANGRARPFAVRHHNNQRQYGMLSLRLSKLVLCDMAAANGLHVLLDTGSLMQATTPNTGPTTAEIEYVNFHPSSLLRKRAADLITAKYRGRARAELHVSSRSRKENMGR